jgi:hypothetical protein
VMCIGASKMSHPDTEVPKTKKWEHGACHGRHAYKWQMGHRMQHAITTLHAKRPMAKGLCAGLRLRQAEGAVCIEQLTSLGSVADAGRAWSFLTFSFSCLMLCMAVDWASRTGSSCTGCGWERAACR